MYPLLIDIILLIVSILFLSASWHFTKKGKYPISVSLLMVLAFLLRLYTSGDFYLHLWDERFHALVAKNMLEDPFAPKLYLNPILDYDFKNWRSNHIWLHKQPLTLWIIALSFKLFGVNEIALRFPSILFSTISVYLTYYIGSSIFNQRIGVLSAYFLAVSGIIIEMSAGRITTDHPDIFFLFFILLAIYFSVKYVQLEKNYFNLLVGICIGLAILCKWLPALIVLPIWLLLALQHQFSYQKIVLQLLLISFTSICIFLPWQIYIYQVFPLEASWEASFNFKHITEVLDNQGGSFFFFLERITINYGALIFLPIGFLFYQFYKNKRNLKLLALIVWIFVPLLFFSLVKTKMQGYILFTAPALFMITAYFFEYLSQLEITSKLRYLQKAILLSLLVLPLIYTIERTKVFQDLDRNPTWVHDLKLLNEKKISKGVLLNYPRPIEAMFYTDLTVYPQLPNKEKINQLKKDGYTVIIFESNNFTFY